MLGEQLTFSKKVLNLKEAARYLDLSESAVYKLTSERKLSFFKPEGKKIFFKREDLEEWMLSNPVKKKDEDGLNSFRR
jgi:excisionase family DNA binding protein